MSDNRLLFSFLENFFGGSVIFGDGLQSKIRGKGSISQLGMPTHDNVLLVEGLKANLHSISQLCDKDHHVSFDKSTCKVFDK
jgi:hypothetical protein